MVWLGFLVAFDLIGSNFSIEKKSSTYKKKEKKEKEEKKGERRKRGRG